MAILSQIFIHSDSMEFHIIQEEWDLLSKSMKAELKRHDYVDNGEGYAKIVVVLEKSVNFDESSINSRLIKSIRQGYSNRERREREREAEGHHSKEDMEKIMEWQNNCCYFCLRSFQLNTHLPDEWGTVQKEHLEPLSLGGTQYPSNMAWICQECNKKRELKKKSSSGL